MVKKLHFTEFCFVNGVLIEIEKLSPTQLFEYLFSSNKLLELYEAKFSHSNSKGVDRLNGFQFSVRSKDTLSVASKKCLDGSFRFSPYLEVLKTKGRKKIQE